MAKKTDGSQIQLPLSEALERGVAAHRAGELQDAERLYRAILAVQSDHPDANHNLGLLLVAQRQVVEALPLFKKALQANAGVEQFWLSFIDALIKEHQADEVDQALIDARQANVSVEKLQALETRLKLALDRAEPPLSRLGLLLEQYQSGEMEQAEGLARSLIDDFPEHPMAWKVLGAVMSTLARWSDAESAMREAVKLAPGDAEAHCNLGVILKDQGSVEEAETWYQRAIEISPRHAEAYSNLGNLQCELGRLMEAQKTCKIALALRPDYAEAHNNLGNVFRELGELGLAVKSYARALTLKPTLDEASFNLGIVLAGAAFNSEDRGLYPVLTNLLTTGNYVRPVAIADTIISLLKNDPAIQVLIGNSSAPFDLQELEEVSKILEGFPLLHELMRVCPLPDIEFEALFAAIRATLLEAAAEAADCDELLNLLSSVALQCFTNEYIYHESEKEVRLVNALAAEIEKTLEKGNQPILMSVLSLATYRPLHRYDWCERLETLDAVPLLQSRLLTEPKQEEYLKSECPSLGLISNKVSMEVRDQYESSPYPRWVKLQIPSKKISIKEVFRLAKLKQYCEIAGGSETRILVAGCGTGQHSIETSSRYRDSHVTAVDLSRSSLAYASRKTDELGIHNISYVQADILELQQLNERFDLIECSGVLHHLENPMIGWRVLLNLLKPGGVMKIGLYSEAARQHIAKIREDIKILGIGDTERDIKEFRQQLKQSHSPHQKKLLRSSDFFSLSTLRDLIFHVQEHQFTLLQLKSNLADLNLKFCGFDNPSIVSEFSSLLGEDANIYSLDQWHHFETHKPDTFRGMYQFWCQKT